MSRVIVVGSANMDYLIRVTDLPVLGETVLAHGLTKQPGGKGANQAVAASRLGADVSFVASLGDDEDGAQILLDLRSEGMHVGDVEITSAMPTGAAMVYVMDDGENSIVVVPGANSTLSASRVERTLRRLAAQECVVVVQAEIPEETVEATLRTASELGMRIVFNLAPYRPFAAGAIAVADPLVVNETEASALLGRRVDTLAEGEEAASMLAGRTSVSAVITLGALGAAWADTSGSGSCPAPVVEQVVDTTGAGDAFVGALAKELADGRSLSDSVVTGVLVGAFSVSRPGAQSSYPTSQDLQHA